MTRPGTAAVPGGRSQPMSPPTEPSETPWLSIVVPLKNEAENLAFVTEGIAAACAAFAPYEIVYVDDGSTDDTAAKRPRARGSASRCCAWCGTRRAPASRPRSTAASRWRAAR